MKSLMRRLSKVADSSSQYNLLRSETSSLESKGRRKKKTGSTVPHGHLPVYVGDEMERFVVSAELLNHPVFVKMLNRSAQEYGYEQKGVLRIPCRVLLFERALHALQHSRGDLLDEVVCALSDDL